LEKTIQDEVSRDEIRPGYRGDRVKWSAANTGDKLEVLRSGLRMNSKLAAAAAKGKYI